MYLLLKTRQAYSIQKPCNHMQANGKELGIKKREVEGGEEQWFNHNSST